MTKEHAQRAYDNAIKAGRQDIADDILIRNPEFAEVPKEEEPKKTGRPKKGE